MSPIGERSAEAAETVAFISERVRVILVTDACVGNMYPIFHNGIVAAALFTVFKELAVERYKFST
jgi:hypothetical protein